MTDEQIQLEIFGYVDADIIPGSWKAEALEAVKVMSALGQDTTSTINVLKTTVDNMRQSTIATLRDYWGVDLQGGVNNA